MKNLATITATMSSREIAQLTGKRHDHVLRDCEVLNENYEKLSLPKVGESTYLAENGQTYREYLLTKMQCFDLMTGYRADLRIQVNRRWEELEMRPQIDFSNPDTVLMLAQNWKAEQEKRKLLEAENQSMRPAVLFMESVKASPTDILVGDLAKLIAQNGVDIGQNRLYDWLVGHDYLIRRQRWSNSKQKYMNYYMPTQRSVELQLFRVQETAIPTSPGEPPFMKFTCYVTGKGQEYFIRKVCSKKSA